MTQVVVGLHSDVKVYVFARGVNEEFSSEPSALNPYSLRYPAPSLNLAYSAAVSASPGAKDNGHSPSTHNCSGLIEELLWDCIWPRKTNVFITQNESEK